MHAIAIWLKNPGRTLAIMLGLVFVLLLARSLGSYPSIFADEYYYNLYTRLVPWAEAWIPSYLYYAVFSSTAACGDGFLECVRLLNALLMVASAPFIYLTARAMMLPARAVMVTTLAMLAPFNVYTAYFMPEVMYYFAFWVMSWLLLRFADAPRMRLLVGAGVVLGLTALIKVHALFLILPLALFLVWVAFARRAPDAHGAAHGTVQGKARHWLLQALLYVAVAVGTATLVRYALGYALAGKSSFQLLGLFYATQKSNAKPLVQLIVPAMQVMGAHLVAWSFLFGVPVAAVLQYGASRAARDEAGPRVRMLTVYAVLMLGTMLGVTSLFSASVVGNGPAESLHRLHLRYYDFMLPMLLMLGAVQLGALARAGQRSRLGIALVLGALLVYARLTLMDEHMPNIVDAPELWSLKPVVMQNLVTGLGLLALLFWVGQPRLGARVFVYLAAPLMVLASTGALQIAIRDNNRANAHAQAGMFVRDYLRREEIDMLTVIGSDHGQVYRAKYHLDNARANLLVLPEGEAFAVGQLGKQRQYALVIGEHPPPPNAVSLVEKRAFALYIFPRTDDLVQRVDLSQPDLGFKRIEGLSGAEPFGRWTDGPRLVLQTMTPLPRALRLHISARAVAGNVGAPVRVRVGDQVKQHRFAGEIGEAVLDFDTDGSADTIIIDIPRPVRASSLGTSSQDQRMIGLAIDTLEVARRKD